MKNFEEIIKLYNSESHDEGQLIFQVPAQQVITRGVLGMTADYVVFLAKEFSSKLKIEKFLIESIKDCQLTDSITTTRLTLVLQTGGRSEYELKKEDANEFRAKFNSVWSKQEQDLLPQDKELEEFKQKAEKQIKELTEATENLTDNYEGTGDDLPKTEDLIAPTVEDIVVPKPEDVKPVLQLAAKTKSKAEETPAEIPPVEAEGESKYVIDQTILDFIKQKKTIQAIREIRKKNKLDLKDAKNLLELIEKNGTSLRKMLFKL